jgi:hypothetical protein
MSAQFLSSRGGHSAEVEMLLLVNGDSIPIAQMGPDFLLLDKPFDHPPSPASLILRVDQNESRWDVHLPQGISSSSQRVAISARD